MVDISNAFFSVPVDKDSQFWFAFNFNGKPYTFTRLCQGYCESPTIFNSVLKQSLEPLQLPESVALLQYVDDLLLWAPNESICKEATVTLLTHLAEQGHKVNPCKVAVALYKGHVLSGAEKSLSDKRVKAIQNIPKPTTKKQMMSFLGMTSYCRTFISGYTDLEAPLTKMIYGNSMAAKETLTWTPEAEQAFVDLKLALQTSPSLGIPDPDKPFTQTVDERKGHMVSVLLQEHGGKLRPVAYFSSKLDSVAQGLPPCLRAVAAAEKTVMASNEFVGFGELNLLVPHAVAMILLEQKTSHLSTARWLRYNFVLLEMPNIHVKRCTVLNPATLLPIEGEGEPHCCISVLEEVCNPRVDLQSEALKNPDLIFFVDGTSSRDEFGKNRAGYAVVWVGSAHYCVYPG